MSTAEVAEAPEVDSSGWRRYQPMLAGVPALVLALVALWEILVICRAGSDVPADAEWERASQVVRAELADGDLIVFAPRWIDPVGRKHLGDQIPVQMAARMDSARYGRIWELSARGARAAETRGLEPVWSRSFGSLELRRYEREPAVVLTDFVQSFAPSAGRVKGSARVELQEVGFEPHRCVLARPAIGGTVTVRYPGAALGTTLVGYAGLADVFTRRDDREPGRVEVLVDGTPVASVQFGVDDGWVRFEASTAPSASSVVEFRATAVGKRAKKRLICFAAEARQ